MSGIRLLPIFKNRFPKTGFFEGNEIKKYNVEKEEFKVSLTKYSIPFHLSHSGYKDTENFPHIISSGMDKNKSLNQIDLGFDLERSHDKHINKKTIDEILTQIVKVMQELDKKLDEKVSDKNKNYLSLGKVIGDPGMNNTVYELKGQSNLACKVFDNDKIDECNMEYEIGKLLYSNGISTVKYEGIKKVKHEGRIKRGLIMQNIKNGVLIKDNIPIGGRGRTIKNTTSPEYKKGKELLEREIEKIEKLGLNFKAKGSWGFDYQGLYVPGKDKIYLIDFGEIIYSK